MSITSSEANPLVGLPPRTFEDRGFTFHSIGDKYLRPAEVARCIPIMIPALDADFDLEGLLDRLDGVVMTGAVSNVHPPHYGAVATERHEPYDHLRDRLTLKLIAQVIERGMPLCASAAAFRSSMWCSAARSPPSCRICPAASTIGRRNRPTSRCATAPPMRWTVTPGGQPA